jgi:hypothetical protein
MRNCQSRRTIGNQNLSVMSAISGITDQPTEANHTSVGKPPFSKHPASIRGYIGLHSFLYGKAGALVRWQLIPSRIKPRALQVIRDCSRFIVRCDVEAAGGCQHPPRPLLATPSQEGRVAGIPGSAVRELGFKSGSITTIIAPDW